ncbi:phage terminase small subunit P27 family [Rummeliibacillus stabekisii]|uniref:phage terminase small subunit P27 family n=1 Tax=Rummeliibacillus stabekisii TaxID=241244 RepID=UPI0037190FCE
MARPRKLVCVNKKHLTKDEIADRKEQEAALEEFDDLDIGDIPSFLDREAKKEWQRISPIINELPISELDRQSLAMYCQYVSIFIQATKDVKKNGVTIIEERATGSIKKQNPSYQTMLSASKEIKSIASGLGLTIDSRMRILSTNKDDGKDENDIFAKMLEDDD